MTLLTNVPTLVMESIQPLLALFHRQRRVQEAVHEVGQLKVPLAQSL